MKVQLACFLAKELLEQNTFSEGDRRKLERFDRKDKDNKFVSKINQEAGEFLQAYLESKNLNEDAFTTDNGIKKEKDGTYGGRETFNFYVVGVGGKLEAKPLVFDPSLATAKTAYEAFVAEKLQPFIDKYNNVLTTTADATAQLSSDIAHNPELGVTKHAAWALDNADAIKDASTQRDMKKAEKRANKFEAKRQERLLDLLDDQEDAIVDTIRDYLKTNHADLNKRQRKVFADMLFDRLYSYDDLTKAPDPIELTHTFKNPVTIQVQKSGLTTIFTSVQAYKADYRAEKGLEGDRRASRFQRKLDAAEEDRQEAFKEYTDLLDASKTMTIDGKSIDISSNDNYKTAILLSDINFDGALRPAKDLEDEEFKRNWLGKILVEGVLRSVGMSQDKSGDGQNYRKYAKSFKNQPINNNLETQISTAREIARARKGADIVDANLKALLQKGFGEAAIPTEKPLYDILKENIEYSMFLKRIFIMEPDILVGLFEHGPKALDIKYAALHEQQKRTQNGADVANTQKIATELMNDPEAKQLALDKIKESDIEAVKSELIRLRNDANTLEPKKKELDKLIKGLDKQENRNKLRWQLASGGLMAMVGAQYRERHQVIYTYDNHANVPILADATGKRLPYDLAYNDDGTPKPGTQATNTYEDANTRKDKLKRTNFSYGLGTGGTLLAESNGSYKQSVTYGISALYSDFATNDPSQQKDGFSFGLSFGYNGTQGLGQVGTSNSYKANINFGVGVGMGADMQGNFVFGPYVYLSPDVLLNGGKLTHTLDAKGAVRLRAGVSGSLNKGLLSFVPNMGLSNDRIEGYTIIEDNLKNKVGPILENILLGLRGRDLSAAATQTEMEKMYADVVMSIDEKLGRSKPKNINKAAKLLSSILSVYAGSDVTKHDDYEAHVKAIAPELATVFANQRWNENIEALRGWKITSVNVGSIFALALFGITPLSIASAVLGTVGTTAYGRAVAENNKPSLAEAQEDFEQNYSATEVVLEPTDPNNLGLGNAASVKLIRDTLVSKDPSLADEVGTLVSSNNAGNLRLDKRVAGLIEVRIANAFTVGEDAAAKTYPITDYLKTDGDFLVVPADMAGGISELVDKNTRKTTLTIGIPIGEPIADAVVWKGTETFAGDPNKFNGTGEVAVADLNAKLQAITVGTATPLAGMSFDYNATSGVLTLNKAGTTPTQVATYIQTGLLGSNKLITISKDATGSYALAIADHNDANFSGLKIDYKETTNVVGGNFGDPIALDFTDSFYQKDLFSDNFVNQFAQEDLLNSIMRGKYARTYNAFNAAMVHGKYDTAKAEATKLLAALKQYTRISTVITFSDDPAILKKQLFRFEALLIYSNACSCDGLHDDAGTVGFRNFKKIVQGQEYKQFGGLMRLRKDGFARRATTTFPQSHKDLIAVRNTIADSLTIEAKNNNQELQYTRKNGAVGIVFGYPEQADTKNQLEPKIVYNPRVITNSIREITITDPDKNKELMNTFASKMDVINGADRLKTLLISKVNTPEAKAEIESKFIAEIYPALMKGEEWTGNNAKVDLDFSFFFYPNCANEGILLEANVAEKPYTPTQNVGNTQVERGLPGPTGFWLNGASVMQRAEVTAVNVGLTAAGTYTKDIPEYVTSKINIPETPTSIPQAFTLPDGTTITIDLAPNHGKIVTLSNGQKFGMQFTGYDENGVPQWNFNFMDDQYNTLAEFGDLNSLQNSSQRGSLDSGLQNALKNSNKAYADQVTWINGNSTAVVPKYLTADQIALQAVQWIDHDRDGLQITVTDRIRKK